MKRRIKCGRSKINLFHLDLALRINNSFGPYFESSWLAQQKGKWRRTVFQGALLQSRQKVPVGGGVWLCSMRCRLSNQTEIQSGTVHPMADVFLATKQKILKTKQYIKKNNTKQLVGSGSGKRQDEFAKWHVAWPAEWHTFAGCHNCKMTPQRNKFYLEECVCKRIYCTPHKFAIPKVIPHDMPQTQSALYPHLVGGSERTEW